MVSGGARGFPTPLILFDVAVEAMFKLVQACLNLFDIVQTCLILSKFFLSSRNIDFSILQEKHKGTLLFLNLCSISFLIFPEVSCRVYVMIWFISIMS